MKVLLISDSHGYNDNIKKMAKLEAPYDQVLHMGDSGMEYSEIEKILGKPVAFVNGNCDWGDAFPTEKIISLDGVKIFMTHGHKYRVHSGDLLLLEYKAQSEDVEAAFFGHTHVPYMGGVAGKIIFNPGSISSPRTSDGRPSYGVMIIENGQIKSIEHRFFDIED